MRKAVFLLAIIGLTSLPLVAASPARAQAARTWVSGTGDDLNPCSRTAPCQTFARAVMVTAPGGEINCLDAGQFGPLSITFSLTISCAAGTAGILVTDNLAGVFINAASTDVITLRGLDIDGQGSGNTGIVISSAKAVHVEKCTIRNIRGNAVSPGIAIPYSSGTIFLFVSDTVISDNTTGVELNGSGGFKVASLKHVTITGPRSLRLQ